MTVCGRWMNMYGICKAQQGTKLKRRMITPWMICGILYPPCWGGSKAALPPALWSEKSERGENMKRKGKKQALTASACQLRTGGSHPFGALKGFVPLGTGEEQIYREMREALPVLDAAVGKLVRLSGGFGVKCRSAQAQKKLEEFLKNVPCGRGQVGIDSFLSSYVDSVLTYGRAVGELVVAGGKLRAVCWGDVTQLQMQEGENPLETVIWGMDSKGLMRPLPYQHLLLFTSMNPEPAHPYGVSIFRGMPFLADILMKIYTAIGTNWERAGNIRYSVICKGAENMDPAVIQERGRQVANEWARAMEDGKNGTVRDFVAVGDVEIKVIGGEMPILDSAVPVRQILEQLVYNLQSQISDYPNTHHNPDLLSAHRHTVAMPGQLIVPVHHPYIHRHKNTV